MPLFQLNSCPKSAEISTKLSAIITTQTQQGKVLQQLMAAISDIQTAQSAEKADLVTLTGLISQLLAAFASGAMTPAQAQAVLDEINGEDATIKSSIGTIQAALPTGGTTA